MQITAPWLDRQGRFSPLRLVALLAAIAPAVWIAYALQSGVFSAEPYKQATHETGTWTLYFLLASLSVTPLMRLFRWKRLIIIRRLLGLTAFAFIAAHFILFVFDMGGDLTKVASEIVKRTYLTVGFVALLGLTALAATSFDAMIRRLGRNWRRLHQLVYAFTALGLLHFFMQSKFDISQPVILTGVFCCLMLYRVWPKAAARWGAAPTALAFAIGGALLGGAVEIFWYSVVSGVPAYQVLIANFDFRYEIRPVWIALAISAGPVIPALALAAVEIARRRVASA